MNGQRIQLVLCNARTNVTALDASGHSPLLSGHYAKTTQRDTLADEGPEGPREDQKHYCRRAKQRQVSQFQTELNQYYVILDIDERQRGMAESLQYFHLRAPATGAMVALAEVARVAPPAAGPVTILHDGMSPAVNLSFNLLP